MKAEKEAIDYRFKILYAVGIIMVVCGHCYGGGISFLISDWFPYSGCHLALFVFCSGYFYKNSAEENVGKYVLKKIKTLVIPLYLYTIAYGFLVQLLRIKGFEIGGEFNVTNVLIAPITNGHQFVYNMGGWFIAPLFMVETCNVFFRKLLHLINKNIHEVVFFVISIVLGICGNQFACLCASGELILNWWLVLARMLYFVSFYGLGIFYKNQLEKYDKLSSFWYFTIIFGIKLIIISYYGKNLAYTPSWCNDFTEGPVMPIVIGYLGIALWMRIASLLESVIGKSKWINLIADNTYSIMMNQFLGFMIVKTIYALICKFGIAFQDFDWISYKTNIWWYYIPNGVNHTLVLYSVTGIVFPILVQRVIDWVKKIVVQKMLQGSASERKT